MLQTGQRKAPSNDFTVGTLKGMTKLLLVPQSCQLIHLQTIHVDMNGAFRNVICKWLRARSACMLFIITWGRWSEISTCPTPLPLAYIHFYNITNFVLVLHTGDQMIYNSYSQSVVTIYVHNNLTTWNHTKLAIRWIDGQHRWKNDYLQRANGNGPRAPFIPAT